MPDETPDARLDELADRLRAVERAVTDDETPVADLSDAAAVHGRLDDLRGDVDELADRLDALDATVQSLHGYVGELDAVNDRVERRADAARAAVDRLEARRESTAERHPGPADDASGASPTRPAADARGEDAGDSATGRALASVDEALQDTHGGRQHDGTEDGDADSLLDRVRESL